MQKKKWYDKAKRGTTERESIPMAVVMISFVEKELMDVVTDEGVLVMQGVMGQDVEFLCMGCGRCGRGGDA